MLGGSVAYLPPEPPPTVPPWELLYSSGGLPRETGAPSEAHGAKHVGFFRVPNLKNNLEACRAFSVSTGTEINLAGTFLISRFTLSHPCPYWLKFFGEGCLPPALSLAVHAPLRAGVGAAHLQSESQPHVGRCGLIQRIAAVMPGPGLAAAPDFDLLYVPLARFPLARARAACPSHRRRRRS